MSLERDSQLWLLLHRLAGYADNGLARLQQHGKTPAQILDWHPDDWQALGVSEAALARFTEWRCRPRQCNAARQAQADWSWLQQQRITLLWPGHPLWPVLLDEITCPPALLYVRGDPAWLAEPQVAVVGSRRASRLGQEQARQLTEELVAAGLVVTSGMAYGIDAAAHRASLQAGGATVAVLGAGLDVPYPRRHGALARDIAEQGALVSEFPLGTAPLPPHFPRRNRLISGLSKGVLVVEAALQSGSLVTARLALEQNREVLAVPGSPANPMARGCNALIRDGAALVETAEDVLMALGIEQPRPQQSTDSPETLAAAFKPVLALLTDHLIAVDQLMAASPMAPGDLLAMLTELELLGVVEQQAGAYRLAKRVG